MMVLAVAACGRLGFEAGTGSNGDAGSGDATTGPCNATGVDVVFDETTKMVDRMTDPASAPTDGERVQIGDGSCPGFTGGMQQPYRAPVIANAGSQPVTISAWATCVAGDMAVLTYYRRATPPLTRTERIACVVGIRDDGSPATGAAPCPGLLATKQLGLPLAVCEKAIVWLQSETGGTLPAMLHIQAD